MYVYIIFQELLGRSTKDLPRHGGVRWHLDRHERGQAYLPFHINLHGQCICVHTYEYFYVRMYVCTSIYFCFYLTVTVN